MTLGNAAAAKVRLIVWCKSCQHQVEPDPAGMAERYGAGATVPDWRERLVCSGCGNRDIDPTSPRFPGRLDRVVAADLQRHDGAELPAVMLLLHLHRAGDVAA